MNQQQKKQKEKSSGNKTKPQLSTTRHKHGEPKPRSHKQGPRCHKQGEESAVAGSNTLEPFGQAELGRPVRGHTQANHRTTPSKDKKSKQPERLGGRLESRRAVERARHRTNRDSLRHCLNFHFETRHFEHGERKPQSYKPRPPVFNRETFLQANFRFVVSDAVDTSHYLSNPDQMFDWEDVLQMKMTVSEDAMCPISLERPPVCPHITPCGHVFSFPSIVHHLMNAGGPSLSRNALCPLCYAPFGAQALRSVKLLKKKSPKIGDKWEFCIVRREVDSRYSLTLSDDAEAKAVERFTVAEDAAQHFHDISSQLADSREEEAMDVYIACIENLSDRAKEFELRRLRQLRCQGKKNMMEVRIVATAERIARSVKQNFYEKSRRFYRLVMKQEKAPAVSSISQQHYNTADLFPTDIQGDIFEDEIWSDEDTATFEFYTMMQPVSSRSEPGEIPVVTSHSNSVCGIDQLSLQFHGFHLTAPNEHSPVKKADAAIQSRNPRKLCYDGYFHQSADEQWIFLHPVNFDCLLLHYWEIENFPWTVSGRIVGIEDIVQTEATRKQYPYLAHLPKQVSFQFLEIDLGHLLPKNCLKPVQLRRAQEAKKLKKAKASSTQQKSVKNAGLQVNDRRCDPPLTLNGPTIVQTNVWSGEALSFASVTRNGYVPRPVKQPPQRVQQDGNPQKNNNQKGRRQKKKSKKRVLLSNASSRK